MSFFMPLAILLVLIAILLAARTLAAPQVEPWVKNLQTAQTLLTIAALAVAAVWYFIDRPHAEKLKFDQTVTGVPVDGGHVMVIAEITITNIGATSEDLTREPYSLYVQQVTPLTLTPYHEIGELDPSGSGLRIHSGDRWSLIATDVGKVNTFLDAGEVENLYYRVIIPCKPGLRVYFTSWFQKPTPWPPLLFRQGKIAWIKQTFLDLSDKCPK